MKSKLKRHPLEYHKEEDILMFKKLEKYLNTKNKEAKKIVNHKTPYILQAIREKMEKDGIV
jgi:hypothetical protein